MYVIYSPEDIVMDRKITRGETDDTGYCHVYYDGDDGSEAIVMMEEDTADALVAAWNEAIDEAVSLTGALSYNRGLVQGNEKHNQDLEDRLAQAMKTKKNYAAMLKSRKARIDELELQVTMLDGLAKARKGEINRLTALAKQIDVIMETHGDDDRTDRDAKLENHHDMRDHYEEM